MRVDFLRLSSHNYGCIALLPMSCYILNMNETLTIRLGDTLAGALEAEARKTGLSKGEIARQALASRLQGAANLTVMKRYAGAMRGPSDLSTNRTYRRQWGKKRA